MAGGAEPRAGRRSAGAVVVLIALAGSLAACSDDPPSPPPPSSSSTASSGGSATPTPTLPVAPEARPTAESAEAFVRYFWDVFNYAHLMLDPSLLKSISEPGCLFCTSASNVVADLSLARKHIRGGLVIVETAAAPPGDLTRNPVITTVISQPPGQTLDSKGDVTSTSAGVRHMRSEVALSWTGSAWRVRDVANDERSGTKW